MPQMEVEGDGLFGIGEVGEGKTYRTPIEVENIHSWNLVLFLDVWWPGRISDCNFRFNNAPQRWSFGS